MRLSEEAIQGRLTPVRMQKTRRFKIIKRLGLGLTIAIALYAVVGFIALPQAARYAINDWLKDHVLVPAQLERVEFNPFTGELNLRDLRIADGDRMLVAFSRLYLDLQIDSVWTQALHLQSLTLDNADVGLRRTKDGALELHTVLNLPASSGDQQEKTAAEGLFPVRIDKVLLNNGKVRWQDLGGGKPVNVQIHPLTLTLQGVSTLPGEKGSLTLHADAGKAGRLDVFADYTVVDRHIRGSARLEKAGLTRFWPYVQSQLPVVLGGGQLDVSAEFDVSAGETLEASIHNGKLTLRSITAKDPQQAELVALSALDASGISANLQKQHMQIDTLSVDGVQAAVVREADGRLQWQRVLSSKNAVSKGATANTAPAKEPAASKGAWRIDIPAIHLQKADVRVTDLSVAPATTLEIKALQFSVHDFDTTNSKPLRIAMKTGLGSEGQLSGEGEMKLSDLSGQMTLVAQNIDLRLAQAYLSPSLRMEVRSGLLDSQLQLQLASTDPLAFSVGGDVRVHQWHAVDTLKDQDLLKWQELQLAGLSYQHGERLLIDKVILQAPYSRFVINENRSTNFGELVIEEKKADSPAPASPSAAEQPVTSGDKPLPIRIGSIDIIDGSAHFADYSLTPNFSTDIAQLNGKIGTLDNEKVTPALLDIKGKVDRYAPVSIEGGLTPFDPLQALDIHARFKRIELTTLTPYSGKFAGYRIRKGRLNLDLHYQIHQGQLNAQNKVVLEELQLGEKVESPDAVDLPVRLAVALLKDADGNIKVELPVEGDLNNPRFDVGPVIWKTFRNLIVRAVKSPFSFIGGLIKGDSSENLDSIAFAPGSSELSKDAIDKLQTVAAALQQRPELRLEIEGASARKPDGEPMARQLLEKELRKVYARQQQTRGTRLPVDINTLTVPADDRLGLLESLYADLVKKPLPPEWKALPEKERVSHMQSALLELLGESGRRLRQLASERAAGIKGWLVDEGGLADDRIYLLNTQLHEEKPAEGVMSLLFLDSQ